MYGYTGKILKVDLFKKEAIDEDINTEWARKFIGGKGLGARYLFEELKPGTDPLSPENILIYMTGPITGTPAPAFSRMAVISKSPLTGTFLDSYVGGYFPAELKYAGFDGILFQGRSEELAYLFIKDGKVDFRSAEDLKGKGTYETTALIKKDIGEEDAKICAIGPAGENKVKIACITFELHHNAGRGGIGAVMGSKNLKAVAVKTSKKNVEISDKEEFNSFRRRFTQQLLKNPDIEWTKRGTPDTIDVSQEVGILPTRNFREGVFEYKNKINWEAIKESIFVKKTACYACPIACRNVTKIQIGPNKRLIIEGPEYETLVLAGSNCGISDLEAIAKFSSLCDDLGLDTISAGNVIAFAMECYERGIIDKKDTGGLDLRFGQTSAYLKMPELIANRNGFGDVLADGVKRAAERIGRGSKDFSLEVKGLEYPGYDPRGSISMALAYATSDRGACHERAWTVSTEAFAGLDPFTIKGKAKMVKEAQDLSSVKWSLISCDFNVISVEEMEKFYELVTGKKAEDFMLIGERIWNLTRLFNVREGFTRVDDTLPKRISDETLPEGPAKGHVVSIEDFQKMLDEYYELRGWTNEGILNSDTLERLALKDLW